MDYRQLDHFGRTRLSQNFFMREFLYSEISTMFRIPNIPDNPDLAIETGSQLCQQILEPISKKFGRVHIRSGFRCARLNEFGHKRKLGCSSNEKNYAYHIWDHLDAEGHKGAAACIVLPSFIDWASSVEDRQYISHWLDDNVPHHRLKFFKTNHAFNLGWSSAINSLLI
jgi:hypothetical protein